jgi:FKBP-type peptidyl-prolyl cis-trans isomerase
MKGMKKGGKRKIVVPPDLAFGADGVPGRIPPNSKLTYTVEVMDIG